MVFPEKLIYLTYRSWFFMIKLESVLKGFIVICFCMSWFIHIFFLIYSCICAGKISPPILGGISFTLESRINLRSSIGKIDNFIHEVSLLIFFFLTTLSLLLLPFSGVPSLLSQWSHFYFERLYWEIIPKPWNWLI